jgi:ribonucleotide monophosphatase NagD (HAD superfamily)
MKLPEDKKVFVVGDKGLEDELNDMGIKFVGGHQVQLNCAHCGKRSVSIHILKGVKFCL